MALPVRRLPYGTVNGVITYPPFIRARMLCPSTSMQAFSHEPAGKGVGLRSALSLLGMKVTSSPLTETGTLLRPAHTVIL